MPVTGPTRISVPATPIAPALTRASLRTFEPVVGPQRLNELLLLATEVVSNAVRHAGTDAAADVEVLVDARPRCVRVAVRDPGPGFEPGAQPTPRPSPEPDASGWGLYLVERVAERWGVDPQPDGTVVWFELELDRG